MSACMPLQIFHKTWAHDLAIVANDDLPVAIQFTANYRNLWLAASWRPSQPLVFHVSKSWYFITNPSLPPGVRRRHLGSCICQMLHLHPDLEEISTIPIIGNAYHSPGFHMISRVFPCLYIISVRPFRSVNVNDVMNMMWHWSIYEVRRLWLQQLRDVATCCNSNNWSYPLLPFIAF